VGSHGESAYRQKQRWAAEAQRVIGNVHATKNLLQRQTWRTAHIVMLDEMAIAELRSTLRGCLLHRLQDVLDVSQAAFLGVIVANL